MVRRTVSLYLATLAGCASPPEGLRLTPDGTGPLVVVDWDAEPLPEIPFPNDLATRPDPTSLTGLRLNLSKIGTTDRESEARGHIDELIGFGIFAPISSAFTAPLDLDEIVKRHPNDLERGDRFDDDAFYVIDVEPTSPNYLKPVDLDVGHGRYPVDVEDGSRYFPNDPRASSPSLLLDTVDEDLDADGELDPGEDTDNDGILDIANVYPAGGDPRTDLLTFYERQTDTLMVRPVRPLREMNRYAVVLTERLVGEDGQPVRSPWKYVNHVRQTDALTPVLDALPDYGLSVDDIAYAWVFTTGRQTGDLVDIHRGLYDGEGPWPFLASTYPASVEEAIQLHTLSGIPPQTLPSDILVGGLTGFGAFGDESTEALVEAAYVRFGGDFVGGSFTTPNLMADKDGDGDDSDEVWRVDPVTGEMSVAPLRVSFTCLLPKGEHQGPWPVVLYGHGHTGSRLEMLLFAWAMGRMGIAACGFDNPGHGLVFPPELRDLVVGLLESQGLGPMLAHLEDSRARDLTGDGSPDSGADQWISDPFHSRDMVRQAVVDQMQLVRALRACGEGEMTIRALDGQSLGSEKTCDWNGDGEIDLGGPDTPIYLAGGSLGGIMTGISAAVLPEVSATAAIVPGGGLLDVGVRSDLGGVISAVMGRMITPLVLGIPTESGGLQITQMVNQYLDMQEVPVATLPSAEALSGGRVVVENLDNGEVREATIPDGGAFRLAIPADAPTAVEKRAIAAIPETGPGLDVYSVPGNEGLGDQLVITLYDASGAKVATIDSWEVDTVYEGVTYEAGSPLVAASHGLGHIRASTDLRRLVMATALAMEPGDPISFAPHWFLDPFESLGGEPTNILVQPGSGDLGVSISAGIALARAGGLLETHTVDDRYGMTPERWLIERGVVRGIESAGPYVDISGYPALFDADDLDEGTDGFGVPSEAPLRSTQATEAGVSGLRISYPSTVGMHGFENPDPSRPFDTAIYVITSAAWYLASGGTEIRDDPCMGAETCPDIEPVMP